MFYSWWNLPSAKANGLLGALTRDWHVSQMAAFRSGFPYTVLAEASNLTTAPTLVVNQTANILAPGAACPNPTARQSLKPGAVAVLDPNHFCAPTSAALGNTGRNEFRGPGLWNIDLSVSRAFPLRFLGDARRLLLRADFFNAFNHANLNNPDNVLADPTFGQSSYGRQEAASGFPALTPLQETPRQVQIILKLEF